MGRCGRSPPRSSAPCRVRPPSPGSPPGRRHTPSPRGNTSPSSSKDTSAQFKYKRKVIELKGVVKGFDSVTIGNDRKVVLGAAGSPGTVECRMAEGQPWAKFSKGQQLTVKGVGPDLQAYPHLEACAVTAAGPNTGVSAT